MPNRIDTCRGVSSTRARVVAPVMAWLVLAVLPLAAAAESTSKHAAAACRLIKGNATEIMMAMHPSVQLDSISFKSHETLVDGFRQKYRLDWTRYRGAGRSAYSVIDVYFDQAGTLDFISVTERSNLTPPWLASKLALKMIKSQVPRDSAFFKSRRVMRAMESGDTKQLLEHYLRFKQLKFRPPK